MKLSVNPIDTYEGRNVDAMPKLLADGRIPMSVANLMHYRMGQSAIFPDWKTNYFDNSDLIVYNSNDSGKAKFVFSVDRNQKITENGRKALGLITPNARLSSGAIELTPEQYQSMNGIEVAMSNLGKTESHLTQDEILGHKVWRILARHPSEVPTEFAEDEKLLQEYSTWVAKQTNSNTNMAVYLDSCGKTPKLKAWYVYRLGDRSFAVGRYALDYGDGRFVGIAPEAPNARILRPTLAQSLDVINQNLGGLEIRTK